jgi:DNA-binding NarL/FixJ family response regulator
MFASQIMIRVGIAEDVQFVAEVLKDNLTLSEQIKVIWHANNGVEAIEFLNQNPQIDVLLMDINMPEMNGIEATKIICKKWPHIKIVMSTVHDDEENIFGAILAGACGYLVKDKSPENWKHAILEALDGGAPMSAGIAKKVLHLLRFGKPALQTEVEDFGITTREKEILENLVMGSTYDQIASSLFISKGTVRKHIEKIYRKLSVNNKIEAIQKAQVNKIV